MSCDRPEEEPKQEAEEELLTPSSNALPLDSRQSVTGSCLCGKNSFLPFEVRVIYPTPPTPNNRRKLNAKRRHLQCRATGDRTPHNATEIEVNVN